MPKFLKIFSVIVLILCVFALILIYSATGVPKPVSAQEVPATSTPPEETAPEEFLPLEAPLTTLTSTEVLGQNFITCRFSSSTYWDNTDNILRELKNGVNPVHYVQGQNWNWGNATCSVATMENMSTSTGNFWLDKKWDYGELFIAFLLFLNLIVLIFMLVFNFFFEPVLKIRGKQ